MHKFLTLIPLLAVPMGLLAFLRILGPIVEIISSYNEVPKSPSTPKSLNYASIESGGKILHASPAMTGSKNLLLDNKDKYMLVPCEVDEKWIEISLNEDIQLEGFRILNQEIYSSFFKEIKLYVATEYPPKEWTFMGKFLLGNEDGFQSFSVEPIWVRFLRVEFVSYYGDEYYCTLTQFSVFGLSMLNSVNKDYVLRQKEIEKQLEEIRHSEFIGSLHSLESQQKIHNIESLSMRQEHFPQDSYVTIDEYYDPFEVVYFPEYYFSVTKRKTSPRPLKMIASNKTKHPELAFKSMVENIAKTEVRLKIIEKYIKYLAALAKNNFEAIESLNRDFKLLMRTFARSEQM